MKDKYKNIGNIEIRTIEECAEVIHILSKVKRFGWDNFHPINKTPNRVLVKHEVDDLRKCLDTLEKKYLKSNG
ncbi:hypothetical protein LCGC14_1812750 [marine sediment metagenome]|uniref:Uncharacterized protein n=1 Tax=marine sediment metagenome TaxID=412755 RepID=A0A0F9H9B7_9ZZZZ